MAQSRDRLERRARDGRQQASPGMPEPRAVRRWSRYVSPVVRAAFRPSLEGQHHLPGDGAFMLVSNHSGLGLPDILCLIALFLGRPGTRFPAAMVHPVSFNSWPTGGWMHRLGAIPSTYEAAHRALAAEVPVLVFPGGDIESTRPVERANRVDFGGRTGFLRIAREASIAIAPVGIRGSHYSAPVLFRSSVLAVVLIIPRLSGVRRFPVTALGVLGSTVILAFGWPLSPVIAVIAAYLWFVLPVSQLPWIPGKVRVRIGEPISAQELFPDATEGTVASAYELVVRRVEGLVRAP